MNIITLRPYGNKKIPVYTKSAQERKEMIDNYYQYCKIEDVEMEECDLWNWQFCGSQVGSLLFVKRIKLRGMENE